MRAQSASPVAAQAPATTAAPYFAENSMNVFRRFAGDGARTLEFYGQVLGFGDVGAVGGVSRNQVGPSQLKFARASANATFTRGAINDAAGVRLWTMWFRDEATVTKRSHQGWPCGRAASMQTAGTAADGEVVGTKGLRTPVLTPHRTRAARSPDARSG